MCRTVDGCVLLILISMVAVGCSAEQRQSGKRSGSQAANRAAVSEEEALAFARAVEAAFAEDDAREFNRLVDLRGAAELAVEPFEISEQHKREFVSGLLSGVAGVGGFHGAVKQFGQDDCNFALLRIRKNENNQRSAIFRLTSDAGINYHELFLVEGDEGVAVEDIYIFITGARMSETWRQALIPAMRSIQADSSWLQRLSAEDREMLESYEDVQRCQQYLKGGQYRRAMDLCLKLPAKVRNTRIMLVMRHSAAANLGERELLDTIREFEKHFPNDAALNLLGIDGFIAVEDYDAALSCVDKLDASLDGDPFLDTARASIQLLAGDGPAAVELCERAVRNLPDSIDARFVLADTYMHEKRYADLANLLTQVEQQFDVSWDNLPNVPEYREFVASPEGKAWMAERGTWP